MKVRKKKKVSPRRQQVRDNIATERFSRLAAVVNSVYPRAALVLILFILATTAILGIEVRPDAIYQEGLRLLGNWPQLLSLLHRRSLPGCLLLRPGAWHIRSPHRC